MIINLKNRDFTQLEKRDARKNDEALRRMYYEDTTDLIINYIKENQIYQPENIKIIEKHIDSSLDLIKYSIDAKSQVYNAYVFRDLKENGDVVNGGESLELFEMFYSQMNTTENLKLLNTMTLLFGISFLRVTLQDDKFDTQVITPDRCYFSFLGDKLNSFAFVVSEDNDKELLNLYYIDGDKVVNVQFFKHIAEKITKNIDDKDIITIDGVKQYFILDYKDSYGNPVLPFIPSFAEKLPNALGYQQTYNAKLVATQFQISHLMTLRNLAIALYIMKRPYISGPTATLATLDDGFDSLNLAGIIKISNDGDNPISVGRLSYDIDFEKIDQTIIDKIKLVMAMQGIPNDNFELTSNKQSGVSIRLSNAPLITKRKEQLPNYRRVEDDLWECIKAIGNGSISNGDGGEYTPHGFKLSGDLSIMFGSMDLPENPIDRETANALAIQNNTKSAIEIIMLERGVNYTEAEKIYNNNIEINNSKNNSLLPTNI